ncbi:MAG: phosphonate ABC transporter substrate-binding protein, partial [Phyllobacterium sp.]
NGPIVVRTSLDSNMKAKFKEFMLNLPKTDPACFAATMGGDFKSYTEVNTEFYQPIIDARKAQIGG